MNRKMKTFGKYENQLDSLVVHRETAKARGVFAYNIVL